MKTSGSVHTVFHNFYSSMFDCTTVLRLSIVTQFNVCCRASQVMKTESTLICSHFSRAWVVIQSFFCLLALYILKSFFVHDSPCACILVQDLNLWGGHTSLLLWFISSSDISEHCDLHVCVVHVLPK